VWKGERRRRTASSSPRRAATCRGLPPPPPPPLVPGHAAAIRGASLRTRPADTAAAADLLLQLRPVVNFAYESKASDLSRSENCFHVAEVLVFSRNNSSTKIFAARQNFGGSLIVT
jgi:hypothetical protein